MTPFHWSLIPLLLWLGQTLAAAVVVLPLVWFSRQRVRWYRWELLAFFVPFAIWALVSYSGFSGSKSLSNMVLEPLILGGTLALGALARAGLSLRLPARRIAVLTLAGLCLAAVTILFFVPALPE